MRTGRKWKRGGRTTAGDLRAAARATYDASMRSYLIRRMPAGAAPDGWLDPLWALAETAEVDRFHPRSSDHRPVVRACALYDDLHLHVRFEVHDRYVRCLKTGYQQMVCLDSCVEFFVRPDPAGGYFNFEVNCGGAMLLYYIENPRRAPGGFEKFTPVEESIAAGVAIGHSLPSRVEQEITDPVTWFVTLRIPFDVLRHYTAFTGPRAGCAWTGNFYKCGDHTSHPHWAAWSDIGETLDFHQPARFGRLVFA